jgi:O-6-methylguanine DNA methyltransferase
LDRRVFINKPEAFYFSSFLTPLGYVYIAKSTHGVCQIAFPYFKENDIECLIRNNIPIHPHLNLSPPSFSPSVMGTGGGIQGDNEYSPPLVGGVSGGGELLQNNKLSRSTHGNTRLNIQRNDSFLKYEIDLLQVYFKGKQVDFDFPLDLSSGTTFQKTVWEKLREIPYGECRSYKWVAEQIGNPRAVRAVGMANNKNPLPPVIPCHRVIGSDGSLTGYASGLYIKKYLLKMEKGFLNVDSPQNTRNKRK